ncbi:hypothetical protein EV715DRAFT_268637, partial [Schizophyllum commune]
MKQDPDDVDLPSLLARVRADIADFRDENTLPFNHDAFEPLLDSLDVGFFYKDNRQCLTMEQRCERLATMLPMNKMLSSIRPEDLLGDLNKWLKTASEGEDVIAASLNALQVKYASLKVTEKIVYGQIDNRQARVEALQSTQQALREKVKLLDLILDLRHAQKNTAEQEARAIVCDAKNEEREMNERLTTTMREHSTERLRIEDDIEAMRAQLDDLTVRAASKEPVQAAKQENVSYIDDEYAFQGGEDNFPVTGEENVAEDGWRRIAEDRNEVERKPNMPSAPWTPPHTMCGNFLKDANVWDQLIKSKRKVITPTGKTGARNARPPKGSSSDSDEEQTETSPLLRKLARQKLVPGTGRSVQDINTDINV